MWAHQLDCLFLSETKVSEEVVRRKLRALHFYNLVYVAPCGRAGGFAVAWKNGVIIDVVSAGKNVINCLVSSDPPGLVWLLSGIYGPPIQSDRKHLWDNFECLSGNFAGPHVIVGDLNSTLEDWETWSQLGHSGSGRSSRAMRELVLRSGFVDLGAQGPAHTWSGHHHRGAIIHARLDRALSNVMWKEVFGGAMVCILPASTSDHLPLLMDTLGESPHQLFYLQLCIVLFYSYP